LVNRNIFKGAETLSLQAHGAYELQENVWAQEWGGQIGLQFPRVVLPFASYDFKRSLRANTSFPVRNISVPPREFRTSIWEPHEIYSQLKTIYPHFRFV
jgi:hypothetical protein